MIALEVPDAALSRLRIRHSPVWESWCAVMLLARNDGRVPFPYRSWAHEVRPRVLSGRPEALVDWVRQWPDSEIPDFLLPVPDRVEATLESEFEQLAGTSGETVRDSILARRVWSHDASFELFRTCPEKSLAESADALLDFWKIGIEPYHTRLASVIDEETLLRGRTLVTKGVDILLGELHTRLSWARPVLRVNTYPDDRRTAHVGALTLIPLVFARGSVLVSGQRQGVRAISYQARGAAVLNSVQSAYRSSSDALPSATEPRDPIRRLAAILGSSRADIIHELTEPSSTTALAGRLGLAPSTVSQHLATLKTAGSSTSTASGPPCRLRTSPAGRPGGVCSMTGVVPDQR